jgi:hypothetical protein
MNTVTKCSPARSRRLARIAMAFACLLPGCEAATALIARPEPADAASAVQQCLQAALPPAREGRHAQIEQAAAFPVGDGSLRIAIDTRIEAYGAVYERRLLCTVAANGSVSRVAGRPVVQRSLARSFADPLLTPAPGCAGTRHRCR